MNKQQNHFEIYDLLAIYVLNLNNTRMMEHIKTCFLFEFSGYLLFLLRFKQVLSPSQLA
jgi:hypothetical protein